MENVVMRRKRMRNEVVIDKNDIYEILNSCALMELQSGRYVTVSVLEENDIMEEFLVGVIDYINENLPNDRIIIE